MGGNTPPCSEYTDDMATMWAVMKELWVQMYDVATEWMMTG